MPYEDIDGKRVWCPTGQHREQKEELAALVGEHQEEVAGQLRTLGYQTTTRSWEKIEDWVDVEFALANQRGRSDALADWIYDRDKWWTRNWFMVCLLGIIVVGLVTIGLTNGWS